MCCYQIAASIAELGTAEAGLLAITVTGVLGAWQICAVAARVGRSHRRGNAGRWVGWPTRWPARNQRVKRVECREG